MNKVLQRVIALIPAVLIQLLWLYVLMRWLSPYAALINLLLSLFAVLYVLYIITNRNESTYKTLWLPVILGLPVFGTILYFCFGNKRTGRPLQKRLESGQALLPAAEGTTTETVSGLGEHDPLDNIDVNFKNGSWTVCCVFSRRSAEYRNQPIKIIYGRKLSWNF